MHRFEYHAVAPADRERVWEVLSNPGQLARLTPGRYRVEVEDRRSALAPGAFVFLRFSFFLRRWAWTSVIRELIPPQRLLEEMHAGPLAAWRHEIRLSETSWGTEVVESVEYRLKYGWVGRLLNRWLVEGALARLFEHRERALLTLLSRPKPTLPESLPPPLETGELDADNVLPLPPRRGKAVLL
ncbi:SRPBCC domain-containing protein [bacterium]|nr:SRPBCC domain-containing protein [bacterium]